MVELGWKNQVEKLDNVYDATAHQLSYVPGKQCKVKLCIDSRAMAVYKYRTLSPENFSYRQV